MRILLKAKIFLQQQCHNTKRRGNAIIQRGVALLACDLKVTSLSRGIGQWKEIRLPTIHYLGTILPRTLHMQNVSCTGLPFFNNVIIQLKVHVPCRKGVLLVIYALCLWRNLNIVNMYYSTIVSLKKFKIWLKAIIK